MSAAGQHADFTFDSSNNWHWQMDWAPHTWSFTAIASSTTIEFYSLSDRTGESGTDDIIVGLVTTDVPQRAAELSLAITSLNSGEGNRDVFVFAARRGAGGAVVTDVHGRRVATLADGEFPAGQRFARWGGADAPPGVYVVTMRAGGRVLARRFALLR